MSQYKRCPVVFNLSNPMQEELYTWCASQSTNFSDFVRTVLFNYKQRRESVMEGFVDVTPPPFQVEEQLVSVGGVKASVVPSRKQTLSSDGDMEAMRKLL